MSDRNEMNCDAYGTYEIPGDSPTANLCNGGWYDGKNFTTCPSKERCRYDTRQAAVAERPGRVSLPQISPRGGSRMLAATPNLSRGRSRGIRDREREQQMAPYQGAPPAIPVDPNNPYLATERAPHQMGPSPTFIPSRKEGVFKRLGKNVAQGWLAATGWHLFDMAQQVDLFPEEDEDHHPQP